MSRVQLLLCTVCTPAAGCCALPLDLAVVSTWLYWLCSYPVIHSPHGQCGQIFFLFRTLNGSHLLHRKSQPPPCWTQMIWSIFTLLHPSHLSSNLPCTHTPVPSPLGLESFSLHQPGSFPFTSVTLCYSLPNP
jgi:hypothetical protein